MRREELPIPSMLPMLPLLPLLPPPNFVGSSSRAHHLGGGYTLSCRR
jgi:hypothetical protein